MLPPESYVALQRNEAFARLVETARNRAVKELMVCPSSAPERLLAAKRRLEGVDYVQQVLADLIKNRLHSTEV
jgi:hypothetical protein